MFSLLMTAALPLEGISTMAPRRLVSALLCLLLALGAAGTVLAAGPVTPKPDPEKGRTLAERLCVACHVVSEPSSAAVAADVPSFPAIAAKEGQTLESVAGRIVIPHPPMPAISLSREEIASVTAYIMSLRPKAP